MTARSPEVLERTTLTDGHVIVRRLRIRLPDGAVVSRDVASSGDAVAVLPYDPERRCALTVQLFRPAVFEALGAERLEEACAGLRNSHEPSQIAARREAREELGLAVASLDPVAQIWSSPGVSTERVELFLTAYAPADRTGPGGGLEGEHEGIEVMERPLAWLAAAADAGRIEDAKLLILVLALRHRRPELFPNHEARPGP